LNVPGNTLAVPPDRLSVSAFALLIISSETTANRADGQKSGAASGQPLCQRQILRCAGPAYPKRIERLVFNKNWIAFAGSSDILSNQFGNWIVAI
jgi:hypothetical protein